MKCSCPVNDKGTVGYDPACRIHGHMARMTNNHTYLTLSGKDLPPLRFKKHWAKCVKCEDRGILLTETEVMEFGREKPVDIIKETYRCTECPAGQEWEGLLSG